MLNRSRHLFAWSTAIAVATACVPDDNGAGQAIESDGGSLDATTSDARTDAGPQGDSAVTDAQTSDVAPNDAASDATDASTDAPADASGDASAGWTISQISIGAGGVQPNGNASLLAISGDGRFVAFTSTATNLVANDTNNASDVFVYDRQAALGTLERVSVSTGGAEGTGISEAMAVSFDGRFVLFTSSAANLVANDTNGANDLFVRDRQNNTTERVSLTSAGAQVTGCSLGSVFADISHDGRFVVFQSDCSGVVAGDTNGGPDVFLRDRLAGTTTRLNVLPDAGQADGINPGIKPYISGNGRFVAFASNSVSLGASGDIFVRDIEAGVTERASVPLDGGKSNENTFEGRVSDDGRYVLMVTRATNQFPNDTNDRDDLALRDREAGVTINASATADGGQATNHSRRFAMMPDAGACTFNVCAPLTDEPAGIGCQNYVRDFRTGALTRVSAPPGVAPDQAADYPAISADGKVVVFTSRASNISTPTPSAFTQVFVATPP